MLLLLSELDLLLLDLASSLLFGLLEDLSLVLSDLSLLVFESFWLGIAMMAVVVLLAYVIRADVVRRRHYAPINCMYDMYELSAVRLAYVLLRLEAQSVARTRGISHGRRAWGRHIQMSLDKHSHPSVQEGSTQGWHALQTMQPCRYLAHK